MAYQITRHLWLQVRGAHIQASNICTGRRALLSNEELLALTAYRTPRELDDSEVSTRLLEADLIVELETPLEENARMIEMLDAVDKFLANQENTTRSRIRKRTPDPGERFNTAEALVESMVPAAGPYAIAEELATLRSYIGVLFDHARSFYTKDQCQDGGFEYGEGFLEQTVGRPLPDTAYEQQPCLPETTQKRVELAAKYIPKDGRCLILGDDDLLSLYWSMFMSQQCDCFELDEQLLTFLRPKLESTPHVTLHPRDLMSGLPEEFHGRYDIIFTDPMYEQRGMDRFLLCCSQGLSRTNPEARVLFTTRPDMIEDGDWLEERIGHLGMKIVKVYKDFTRYALPGFGRKWMLRAFSNYGVSAQLAEGLMRAPYLYADMHELQHA